jgi:hypothetical protein
VLDDHAHDVDAEAIHSAPHPEAQDIVHCLAERGVPPVDVGLLLEERVVVVLARRGIELPRAAAEIAEPVIRGAA